MDEIIERIKEAYHFKTDAEVAKFLGIQPSTLSMQKNRGRLNLKRIIEKCSDLNQNWLLHGRGQKRTFSHKDDKGIPIYTKLEVSDSTPDFKLSSKAGNIITNVNKKIECLSDRQNNVIGVLATGDAMAPTIKKSDIAFIDLERNPVHDSIFLISSPRKILLRRIREVKDCFIAKSDNGNHRSIEITSDNGYELIGKLIWVLRRM